MTMAVKQNKAEIAQTFTCGYCGKEYQRESSLIKHTCEKKKRALLRDTRDAKVALDIWLRFRKFARMPYKKTLTPYDAFSASTEFNAFITFAKYLIEIQPLEPEAFVDELLRDAVPMRDWSTQKVRTAWTHKVLRREHPEPAVSRSIERVSLWATETGNDWRDFFKEVSVHRAILLIETGRISPWFIWSASTRQELFDRFSDEEFMHIYEYIDPKIWNPKKIKFKEDFERIQEILQESGL